MSMDTRTSQLAMDPMALNRLKTDAALKPQQSLKAVTQQFEGFLLNFMMKGMRDTVPKSDATQSMASQTYTSMLDQQYAQKMSEGKGLGIASMLNRQFEKKMAPAQKDKTVSATIPSAPQKSSRSGAPEAFKSKMVEYAEAASKATGIPTNFLLAQAGLESGWGQHQPKLANGVPSFNLFGMKASSTWSGPTTDAVTTEVLGGVPTKVVQSFKVYGSYEEAFQDYAKTLIKNSRYNDALGAQSASDFAHALQKAGYATDPHYASTLQSIIRRMETPVA